ncbi:MAG: hypothetical protein WCI60_01970 [bacterium]|jgi:hypothetical protein
MFNVFADLSRQRQNDYCSKIKRTFIRKEAKIGGQVFGNIHKNMRREFFCLDKNTWIWHEEWTDTFGKRQIVTTRYSVRPEGIIKAHNDQHYQKVHKEEAVNLIHAASVYLKRVQAEVY